MNNKLNNGTDLIKFSSDLIKAEVVADSINEQGDRITTFVCTFPRIILSEFNTHRLFSRNSASSRAIPFAKQVEKLENEPFIPSGWMEEHKGMQGSHYFEEPEKVAEFKKVWLEGRDAAIASAKKLSEMGLTKQITNRIMEPYMMHTIIVTATEWDNYFALRAHDEAEIHIAEVAFKMLEAYNASNPKKLKGKEWHIPFGGKFRMDEIEKLAKEKDMTIDDVMIAIATARCARVSYLNFAGQDDYAKDLGLFNRLSSAGHWSPFEHCAQAMTADQYQEMVRYDQGELQKGWYGNVRGFVQWRKTFKNENKEDLRVKK